MPTPRTEGVPTLRETSAVAHSDGSLVPSSWLAQLEGRANGLAVVFGDAKQAINSVVAFRILDAAGAHQRSVHRLRGGKYFDGVDIKLTVLVRRAIGVNAQNQVARNGSERRGQLRGVFDVARGELRGGELQAGGIDSADGAEEMDVQGALRK